jgi:raffinose/stachyose/melibiose transport system permease protein
MADRAREQSPVGRPWRRQRGGPRRPSWLLLVPGLALLLAVHYLPQIAGGSYAFTSWNGLSTNAKWIGLGNFREIFHDPIARGGLYHTLELAGAFVVLVNVVGLGLALGLNRAVKSRILLRSVFFLPAVVSPLALGFIWRYIFDYNGALNQLLKFIGEPGWQRPWLGDPKWALWTILVVLVWQYSGLVMILYLAGLQGVPDELQEAASVDGASTWLRFRAITLPMLAPAMTVSITLMTIFGLRVFDQVLALTGGGPVYASETLATQVYQQIFLNGRFGYGSALAFLLSALIAVLAMTQAVILRRREERI